MSRRPSLFVTGASGFVGAHFCRLAAGLGFRVRGLWRNTPLSLAGVEAVQGDVTTIDDPGADVVIHLAAKVMADDARAQNRRMLDRVLAWGRPIVYASSTMVHWPLDVEYAASRREDEARVVNSGLDYLIVRPCAPYGPRIPGHTPAHTESFHTLADWVRRLPAIPVVGNARYRRQPVHVDDFNGAILRLVRAGAWGGEFDAGGPKAMTMVEIVHALGGKRILHIPRRLLKVAGPLAGLSRDVVSTFDTDDVVDPKPLAAASGLSPREFDPGVLANI